MFEQQSANTRKKEKFKFLNLNAFLGLMESRGLSINGVRIACCK